MTTIICHCMGETDDAARIAEQKLATAALSLYGDVVDGRMFGLPTQVPAQSEMRDDDQSPPLYDLAVEWRLRTIPAT